MAERTVRAYYYTYAHDLGEEDDFLEKNLTANTQNYVRDLQIRFVLGASHWVQQECPDEVNELIQGFVTSTEQTVRVD